MTDKYKMLLYHSLKEIIGTAMGGPSGDPTHEHYEIAAMCYAMMDAFELKGFKTEKDIEEQKEIAEVFEDFYSGVKFNAIVEKQTKMLVKLLDRTK